MNFYKMHGAGNDFVMLTGSPELTASEIAKICHRRTGIGADGLIYIEKANEEYSFIMHYFNSNGSSANFCGNGARCALFLAWHLKWFTTSQTHFKGGDGVHLGRVNDDESVSISISSPHSFEHLGKIEDIPLDLYFVNTGVEHVVCYVEDLSSVDVDTIGRKIRHLPHFKNGTNVNFINKLSDNTISIRTYERGVEAETLACGTGISAAVYTDIQLYGEPQSRKIKTIANFDLSVGYEQNTFVLTGPAVIVAYGSTT